MEEILGYSREEYLITFQSIILGFVTSEYFAGGGEILRQRIRFKPTSIFLLFAIVSFSNLLIFWWNVWRRSVIIDESGFEFVKGIGKVGIFVRI